MCFWALLMVWGQILWRGVVSDAEIPKIATTWGWRHQFQSSGGVVFNVNEKALYSVSNIVWSDPSLICPLYGWFCWLHGSLPFLSIFLVGIEMLLVLRSFLSRSLSSLLPHPRFYTFYLLHFLSITSSEAFHLGFCPWRMACSFRVLV